MSEATYEIRSGRFTIFTPADDAPGTWRAVYEVTGYAGRGRCRNNPSCETISRRGPIPRGVYRVHHLVGVRRFGPVVFDLQPVSTNQMHGRSGFLIHGDSAQHPGNASSGCIILSREAREAVEHFGVTTLIVVPDTREAEDLNTSLEVSGTTDTSQ